METSNVDNLTAQKWLTDTYESIKNSPLLAQAVTTVQVLTKKAQAIALETFAKIQEQISVNSLHPVIAQINRIGTDVEKVFNAAECIPFLCVLTSALRASAGKVQVVFGAVIAGIGELGRLLSRKPADSTLMTNWHVISKLGREHILHGCLNVLRGTGASILAACTFGVGNVVLLVPNMSNERNFNPYFAYGTLLQVPDTIPTPETVVVKKEEKIEV